MTYQVKEIFATRQGEGFHTGRPGVFLRFAGCNLWSGLERDRANAVCNFCDTDFVGLDGPGGGKYRTPQELAQAVAKEWLNGQQGSERFVVITGGEPLLQLDSGLIDALHDESFVIALETNGTLRVPSGVDWICVSPKAGTTLIQREGNELKLIYPQNGLDPDSFSGLNFEHFYLQPMDGAHLEHHTRLVIDYCRGSAIWNVSIQSHKYLGIP